MFEKYTYPLEFQPVLGSMASTGPDGFQWAAQGSTGQHRPGAGRAIDIKIRGPLAQAEFESRLQLATFLHRQTRNRTEPESGTMIHILVYTFDMEMSRGTDITWYIHEWHITPL